MAEAPAIRRLAAGDLRAYKALRDTALTRHPEAFTSDAPAEGLRRAEDYLPRLGLERSDGGHLLLGAFLGSDLVGAIGLERDARAKVRHIGHVVGMMVRDAVQRGGIGRALLDALVAEARHGAGLEMLTLTVTDGNAPAVRLYERAGFERYGTLPNAIKIDGRYHAKIQMVKFL